MKTIYVAAWGPSLIEAEVEEKPNTYRVLSTKALIGWSSYVGRVINKSDPRIYADFETAIAHLVSAGEVVANDLEGELSRVQNKLGELRALLEAARTAKH